MLAPLVILVLHLNAGAQYRVPFITSFVTDSQVAGHGLTNQVFFPIASFILAEVILVSVALLPSFRAFQYRHRRLVGLADFLTTLSEWWPR